MLHIHTVGMIGQEVLGQQGVRDCACDQIGAGHDGCLSLVMAKGHRSRVGGGLWDNNPTKIFGTPPGPLKGVF